MRRAALVGVAVCFAVFAGPAVLAAPASQPDASQPVAAQPDVAPPKAAPPKAAPPKAAKPKVADWTGTWSGPVTQVGRAKSFAIEVTLASKTGTTNYPDEHCKGKLVRTGTSGDYAFFIETITEGKLDPASKRGCLDGSLTLLKSPGGVVMSWMAANDGKAIVAYGSLAAMK